MRDDDDVKYELSVTEADLAIRISELRDFFTSKLELPRRVIDAVRDARAFVERNPYALVAGGIVLGLLVGARRHAD